MRFLILLLLLLPSLLVAQAAPVAGTYAVWLCQLDCALSDTTSAPVAGFLVLSEDTLRMSTLPEETQRRFTRLRGEPARGILPLNACFSLARRSSNRLLAGIIPHGLTDWSATGDTLTVRLYQSPDAFYTVTAVISGGSLLGSGREHGVIGKAFDRQVGPVHGLRIGPPDLTRCTTGSGSR